MQAGITVSISQGLLQELLTGAKMLCPRETTLLLRGKKQKSTITVTEFVVPPLATYGRGFASIPIHMLPTDFSLIGTAHSHPSGNLTPSPTDLNHFFGIILIIIGYPFMDERNIAAYDHNGERLSLQITKP